MSFAELAQHVMSAFESKDLDTVKENFTNSNRRES